MLPLSHTSHWSLHFMKNVKNRRKKRENKTQSPSDTSPCTHKTISQAFMPASRSPRHQLWSSILVVPTAQQLSPDGCQGEILLSLCTRFTDVSLRTHIPANWREGKKGRRDHKLAIDGQFSDFLFPPWRWLCKTVQFTSVVGAEDLDSVCRDMPVGHRHTRARRPIAFSDTPKAPGQPPDLLWPHSFRNWRVAERKTKTNNSLKLWWLLNSNTQLWFTACGS